MDSSFLLPYSHCKHAAPLSGIIRDSLMVSFCTRHTPDDSQSQSIFAANQSKDMLKYDQPVKKPMM